MNRRWKVNKVLKIYFIEAKKLPGIKTHHTIHGSGNFLKNNFFSSASYRHFELRVMFSWHYIIYLKHTLLTQSSSSCLWALNPDPFMIKNLNVLIERHWSAWPHKPGQKKFCQYFSWTAICESNGLKWLVFISQVFA